MIRKSMPYAMVQCLSSTSFVQGVHEFPFAELLLSKIVRIGKMRR